MAVQAIVRHRLDLLLRLLDSTTGREISDRRCQMIINPEMQANPVARGDGTYLFLGIGRTNFEIDIHVYGYESQKAKIVFEDLDENLPVKEIYLLPKAETASLDIIQTLRGNLPGIKEIEAVSLCDVVCNYKEYDKRMNVLRVFNQHNVKMKHIHYGIIDTNEMVYDRFEIKEELSTQEVRLKEKLEKEYTINQPIAGIIFGQVSEDGEYKLAVRAGKLAYYLVRYVVNDTVHFKKIDFNHLDEQSL